MWCRSLCRLRVETEIFIMADTDSDGLEGSPPKRAKNISLTIPTDDLQEENENENLTTNRFACFSPDALRRQRFLSETSEDGDGRRKKHDFFQTLQETLEVLRDEAVTSRDSNKAEDHWCHPFEISSHPIEQFEMKKEEIDLQRQQSKFFTPNTPELKNGEKLTVDIENLSSCGPYPNYQRLSISGSDISGVSGKEFFLF